MVTEPTPGKKPGRPRTKAGKSTIIPPSAKPALSQESKLLVRSLIEQNPEATDAEVAEQSGVSRTSVQRIRERIDTARDESTEQYGRRLAKRLPMSKRVRLWAELAEGGVDPKIAFSQKAALQRVEELIGHVTEKEKRQSDANKQGPVGPLIILPPGSAIMFAPPQVVVDADNRALPASVSKPDTDDSTT